MQILTCKVKLLRLNTEDASIELLAVVLLILKLPNIPHSQLCTDPGKAERFLFSD